MHSCTSIYLSVIPAASPVTAAAAEAPDDRPSAVIWTLVDDGALPFRVILGRSDESATELVEAPLRAGQQVIIGTATPPQERSWFGFRWSL